MAAIVVADNEEYLDDSIMAMQLHQQELNRLADAEAAQSFFIQLNSANPQLDHSDEAQWLLFETENVNNAIEHLNLGKLAKKETHQFYEDQHFARYLDDMEQEQVDYQVVDDLSVDDMEEKEPAVVSSCDSSFERNEEEEEEMDEPFFYIPPTDRKKGQNDVNSVGNELCQICFDSFVMPPFASMDAVTNEGFELSCGHAYCKPCLSRWITTAVQGSGIPLNCPREGCKNHVKVEEVKEIVENESIYTRFSQMSLQHSLSDQSMYCPNKTCSSFLLLPPSTNSTPTSSISSCPQCDTLICLHCRVCWHDGFTCEAYENLPLGERNAEDIQFHDLANSKKWVRCPSCAAMVERREGCNHIKCRCGAEFCYRCGIAYKNDIITDEHPHGQPACNCALFDVPEEVDVQPAPAPAPRIAAPRPPPRAIPVYNGPAAHIGIETRYDSYMNRESRLPEWLVSYWQNFECHYCGRRFNSLMALDMHQSNTNQHEVHSCCGRTFKTEMDLERHQHSPAHGYY